MNKQNEQTLQELLGTWDFVRGMTYQFIDAIPDSHWDYTPKEEFSPLSKQIRHMVWVTGLYASALRDRKLDFSKKKSCYSGGLGKAELISALRDRDRDFKAAITEVLREFSALDAYRMDFFGSPFSVSEFVTNAVQHESIHHGLWAMYAAFGGFKTPGSWQQTWDL